MVHRSPDMPEKDGSRDINAELKQIFTEKLPKIQAEYEKSNTNLDIFEEYIKNVDKKKIQEIDDEIAQKMRVFIKASGKGFLKTDVDNFLMQYRKENLFMAERIVQTRKNVRDTQLARWKAFFGIQGHDADFIKARDTLSIEQMKAAATSLSAMQKVYEKLLQPFLLTPAKTTSEIIKDFSVDLSLLSTSERDELKAYFVEYSQSHIMHADMLDLILKAIQFQSGTHDHDKAVLFALEKAIPTLTMLDLIKYKILTKKEIADITEVAYKDWYEELNGVKPSAGFENTEEFMRFSENFYDYDWEFSTAELQKKFAKNLLNAFLYDADAKQRITIALEKQINDENTRKHQEKDTSEYTLDSMFESIESIIAKMG